MGCGGGATLARLLHQYPEAQVYGVDYSPEGVALSKEFNKENLDTRCHIQEGSVLELPYDENQFSLVTAFETVYFWKDFTKAFSEVQRVLQNDGTFLVCCEMSDPENPKWKEAAQWMTLDTGLQWKTRLEQAGFQNVRLISGEGEWIVLLCKGFH